MIAFDSATTLLACRHGQSIGNTARADAEARGLADVGTALSDAELPLTDLGHEQAAWLGRQIAALPPSQHPTRIVCSPHRRALETADGIVRQGFANCRIAFTLDARLMPKACGVLEGLTRAGVAERYPQLAAQRERVGRFHFRPPGGESRCDVVMRVHRFLADLIERSTGERVLLVTHQIVINALDYLLQAGRDDALTNDADGWVPNARLYGFALGAIAGPIAGPVSTGSAVAA